MPYALFSNEAKLSKAYPTEADVWKVARKSGPGGRRGFGGGEAAAAAGAGP